jgi:hypothetical protein
LGSHFGCPKTKKHGKNMESIINNQSIINNLSKDPLYLILTIFTAVSSIILIILYIIEKRIENKIKEKKQKKTYKEGLTLIEHENQ